MQSMIKIIGFCATLLTVMLLYISHAFGGTIGYGEDSVDPVAIINFRVPVPPPKFRPKYTASECLIGVQFIANVPHPTASDWVGIATPALDSIVAVVAPPNPEMAKPYPAPIVALHFVSQTGIVYMGFWKNCDRRDEIAKDLLTRAAALATSWTFKKPFPAYEVMPKPVTSQIHTLLLCGPWWIDGNSPACVERHERGMDRIWESGSRADSSCKCNTLGLTEDLGGRAIGDAFN